MHYDFTIDALTASGDQAWRLLADGKNWRPCQFAEDAQPHDNHLTDNLEKWIGHRLVADKRFGLALRDRPGIFDFLMRGIFAHAVVHRYSQPPIPDKADMVATLALAQPGSSTLLYLDLTARFRLLDAGRNSLLNRSEMAVRGELASSPAYIGPQAAADSVLTDQLFRQFLGGWLDHLVSRRLSRFVPDIEKTDNEASLRQRIVEWKAESLCAPFCAPFCNAGQPASG